MFHFNDYELPLLWRELSRDHLAATVDLRTMDLARAMGKAPVLANNRAGFVSNRVLMPLINEAFYAWMEDVAKPEDIDQIMLLGCNFPMRPQHGSWMSALFSTPNMPLKIG